MLWVQLAIAGIGLARDLFKYYASRNKENKRESYARVKKFVSKVNHARLNGGDKYLDEFLK